MSFIEKDYSKEHLMNQLTKDELEKLYFNTYRCPFCYEIPLFELTLDLNSPLYVKVTCNCMSKDFEISNFLEIYRKDFRNNIQCNYCKEFASKTYVKYKFCLNCNEFYCSECAHIHVIKEKHYFINFQEIGTICPEHRLYYQSFCKNCMKNICEDCCIAHNSHQIVKYESILLNDLELKELKLKHEEATNIVLVKDIKMKDAYYRLLQDVDEFNKKYIFNLFDENRTKNTYILEFFEMLFNVYEKKPHKTYNMILNIRNNINYDLSYRELDLDEENNTNTNINTILNNFYLFAKNHCIAKKCRKIIEKTEKVVVKKRKKEVEKIIKNPETIIKTEETDELYRFVFSNSEKFLNLLNKLPPLKDEIDVVLNSPYKFKNYIYFGEFKKDEMVPHGKGILYYRNGDHYYGYFQNGKKSKLGIYFFRKKIGYYKGEWEDNKMSGYGIYYLKNKNLKYEGQFKNNKKNGVGILTLNDGNKIQGAWINNEFCEIGQITTKKGQIYKGEIKNYKKDGNGYEYFPTYEKYIGLYSENKFSIGRYYFNNGNKYYGSFKDNKMHGFGKMKYPFNEFYSGNFFLGKKQGVGRYYYSNGDIYEGYWFDDLRNDFGILKFKNGDSYTGEFIKDIKHGIGIFYNEQNGDYYIGEFEYNQKQGIASIYNDNCNYEYEGCVSKGVKEGMGIYKNSKILYKGEFKNNLYNGYGKILNGGSMIEGIFKNGDVKKIISSFKPTS